MRKIQLIKDGGVMELDDLVVHIAPKRPELNTLSSPIERIAEWKDGKLEVMNIAACDPMSLYILNAFLKTQENLRDAIQAKDREIERIVNLRPVALLRFAHAERIRRKQEKELEL